MLQGVRNEARNAVTDRALVERLRTDDSRAFDTLFNRHIATVYAYSYSRLRNRSDAEEAAQETFIALWERRHNIVIGETVVPWLLTAARYRCLNILRSRSRRRVEPLAENDGAGDADPTPETAELAIVMAALTRAVASLSKADRQIYALCVDGEMTYADAAKQIGITHAAVRGRLARLRQTLRDEIALLRGR